MIEFEKVLGAFSHLADLTEAQAREESALLSLALGEVAVMLRPGACTPESHDRICHACAAFAYYKHALVAAMKAVDFKAGDIAMSPPGAALLTLARQLRDDAVGSIADLVDADGFAFVQVAP